MQFGDGFANVSRILVGKRALENVHLSGVFSSLFDLHEEPFCHGGDSPELIRFAEVSGLRLGLFISVQLEKLFDLARDDPSHLVLDPDVSVQIMDRVLSDGPGPQASLCGVEFGGSRLVPSFPALALASSVT